MTAKPARRRNARPAAAVPRTAAPAGDPGPAPPGLAALWAGLGGAARIGLVATAAATLIGLLAHSWFYRFLTDDAYITFRYARNLSDGFGLVFNPGMERVEGYSNFLWTLILAALQRAGIAPERAANALSLLATVALWAVVTRFALRRARSALDLWLALVPAALLAVTRSIAVWSTSGLETRLFELLLVAGALRLVAEVEAESAGTRVRWLSPWLFALATLTRPDGLLLSACAFGAAGWILWRRGRLVLPAFLRRLLPFLVLVGGHFAFRRIYYGYWLPNTYYAQVGGQLWWSAGLRYLEAFAIEYAMWLWLPLALLGARRLARRGEGALVWICGALILPHLLYIAAIGGDHFEYRPLDLYLPFLYLLVADGVGALLRGGAARPAAAARVVAGSWLALTLAGIWQLPWATHRQYPDEYQPGFPGGVMVPPLARRLYLDPDRDPVYRLPVLRALAARHRALLNDLSRHFVGLRQEEHRMFLASVAPEGRRLAELGAQGLLPPDVHLAMACVGAIPYYSNVRTLDVLGLTDAHVAHSGFAHPEGERTMAHDKMADYEYVKSRGVDLWAAEGVHSIAPLTSSILLGAVREAVTRRLDVYAADVGRGDFLIGYLPQGPEAAARRMPRLRFRRVAEPAFVNDFLARGIAAYRDSLARDPGNARDRFDLAYLLFIDKQFAAARTLYLALAPVMPASLDLWENLSICEISLGRRADARFALERGLALSIEQADTERAERLRRALASLDAAPPDSVPR